MQCKRCVTAVGDIWGWMQCLLRVGVGNTINMALLLSHAHPSLMKQVPGASGQQPAAQAGPGGQDVGGSSRGQGAAAGGARTAGSSHTQGATCWSHVQGDTGGRR
jgi:hypothetical protein